METHKNEINSIANFDAIVGNWENADKGFFSNNLLLGDCFALSQYRLNPTGAYVYECTLTKGSDDNFVGGLLFGVSDKENIISGWYAVTVDYKAKSASIFRNCYTPTWRIRKWLTEEEINATEFKLRLEIVDNELSFYLNDRFLSTKKDNFYCGGYIGLYSQKAVNYYNNISITELDVPEILSVSSNNAVINKGIEYTDFQYNVSLPTEQEKINLSMVVNENCIPFINDIAVVNGESISLDTHIGSQTVVFTAKDKDSGLTVHQNMHISRAIDSEKIYRENFRPQLHYTPKLNWMNDPNGLMYNDVTKEYHLFYQYNPYSYDWGNMSWGHAVSKDLIVWNEKDVIMHPDRFGTIFSGCGVIDENNTSGLFDESVPSGARMVALYTYDSGDASHGWQNIALAYSKDNGDTWTKYNDGESVILNPNNMYSSSFRDPKVIWIEDETSIRGGKWLLIVAGGRARIFTSDNLINWKHENDLFCFNDNGEKIALCSECPDLYPLVVKNTGENKWVYNGGGKFIVVGNIVKDKNGNYDFAAETTKIPIVNKDSKVYATQSFYNDSSNRRLHISWIRDMNSANQLYNYGKIWNGVMTIPKELSLIKTDNSYALAVNPVEELKQYRRNAIIDIEDATISENSGNIFEYINENKLEISASIDLGTASEIGFKFCKNGENGVLVKYDVSSQHLILDKSEATVSGKQIYNETEIMECNTENNILNIHIILDVSVIDVYANDGTVGTTSVFYAEPGNLDCSFYVKNGDATIKHMEVYDFPNVLIDNNK